MRSTLGDVRPYIAPVWSWCNDDARVPGKVNEIQARLLPMGKWVDAYQHYRFCVRSACITLPWQLETIETCAINNYPMPIHSEWYQYIKDGYGLLDGNTMAVEDKGSGWVAFDDVVGANKKLRVYSDTPEAAGATILLEFWNQNKLPVRTEYPAGSGTWINGERVAISQVQTNTVNFCMANGLVAVQKPVTNGNVYLYEYDTVLLTQKLLAIYEPDEVRPNYRRYVIPYCNQDASPACSNQTVDVIAKRRFIPARNDNDWLIVGNPGALKMGAMALRKEENNLPGEAAIYWYGGTFNQNGTITNIRGARGILDDELNQFLGDGMQSIVQMTDEFANADVESFV